MLTMTSVLISIGIVLGIFSPFIVMHIHWKLYEQHEVQQDYLFLRDVVGVSASTAQYWLTLPKTSKSARKGRIEYNEQKGVSR